MIKRRATSDDTQTDKRKKHWRNEREKAKNMNKFEMKSNVHQSCVCWPFVHHVL